MFKFTFKHVSLPRAYKLENRFLLFSQWLSNISESGIIKLQTIHYFCKLYYTSLMRFQSREWNIFCLFVIRYWNGKLLVLYHGIHHLSTISYFRTECYVFSLSVSTSFYFWQTSGNFLDMADLMVIITKIEFAHSVLHSRISVIV